MKTITLILLIVFFAFASLSAQQVFVEAEAFEDLGGWVNDPQFIDQMGSPYLLAHGKGIRVEDAVTNVNFNQTGNYHVWVRTFNWNAPWNKNDAPGIFQLIVDGQIVGEKLGDQPETWGWQKAGQVKIENNTATLALHDLTGFEGRCDAIFFSKNPNVKLPDSGENLVSFRKKILGIKRVKVPEQFDFIVVGGGFAGIASAVSAARLGLKTLLIHNRTVFGGNSSPEISIHPHGGFKLPPYDKIGTVIAELGYPSQYQDRIVDILKNEKNLTVRLNHNVFDAKTSHNQITSVIAKELTTGEEFMYSGHYFADCTGDGNLGFLAGAEYRMGRETRKEFGENLAPEIASNLSYGSTLKWHARTAGNRVNFPECPWAIQFTEVTSHKVMSYQWFWEAGYYKNQITDAEYIRDYWFRVIYGNWSFLKNHSTIKEKYTNADLYNVSHILGKRESRRLLGDHILTQMDVEGDWKKYPDSSVICTYTIDQHFPQPENSIYFPGEEFISEQKHNHNPLGPVSEKTRGVNVNMPYMLPYRCLYSKNIDNLFMAGRDISATRIAMTSFRVQGTTGMMGEVIAIAANLCKKYNCEPREIYTQHLDELKVALKKGVPAKYESILKAIPM